MAVAAAPSAISGGGGRRERRRGAGDGDGAGVGGGGHDVGKGLVSLLSRRVRRRSGGDTALRCHPHRAFI